MKTDEQILTEVIDEIQPSAAISGEIEWDTCIEAMKRYANQFKSNSVPTLHLILKKKWFDMILSGAKTEEYRDITPLYQKRFLKKEWTLTTHYFKRVKFQLGYQRNAPTMIVECLWIEQNTGLEVWGAEPGKKYFVLKLGQIIEKP